MSIIACKTAEWSNSGTGFRVGVNPNSMLVAAARLARQGPAKTEIDKNQAAIAGLHRRRAKLLENVAKIEATIANLERDGESATADEV